MKHLLISLQVLTAASLVLSARPRLDDWMALVVSVCAVLLGIWAIIAIGPSRVSVSPDVSATTALATAGPYRIIRHPMYSALILFAAGFVVTPFRWWKATVWAVLVFILIMKSRVEERQLNQRFEEYAAYMRRTWRFVPFIW